MKRINSSAAIILLLVSLTLLPSWAAVAQIDVVSSEAKRIFQDQFDLTTKRVAFDVDPISNKGSRFVSHRGPFQVASEVDERIRRVENGLLPPMTIKGQPAEMKLADRMKFYRIPGVSIAVINNGKIEWARGFGVVEAGLDKPITPETLFQAGSISKPVAAMAALRLVEQGKLNLDEDVNLKLKSWKVVENDLTKEKKVTLRGLLTHSAGLTVHGFPGYAADSQVPTLVQVLNGEKPANTGAIRVDTVPGTKWRYSGGGYTILQQLLIDVTGKTFPELTHDLVLKPAGMKQSTYEQPLPKRLDAAAATAHRNGSPIKGRYHAYPEMAAAGLWTTPTDLALLAIEIQQEIAGKSSKVLSSSMAQQMTSRQFENYGLGPSIDSNGQSMRFGHGGVDEGFEAFWVGFRQTGQGAVVMTNGNGGSRLAQEIIRAIAKEYNWADPPGPRERAAIKIDPETFDAYVGEYELRPGFSVTFMREGEKFFTQATGQERIEIFAEAENVFFLKGVEAQVTFVKDDKGQVTQLVLRQSGREQIARKTK